MPADLPLAAPLAEALRQKGYDTLTPVQEAMLATEASARDLLVSAQTGSGKTVAFGLALAPTLLGGEDRLPAPGDPAALIIAPTRELALQVTTELRWLYAPAGGRVASCVGGMDVRDERRALERGAQIVVGTPGRLVDHIKRGALRMASLQAVVLDEADEMLKMGFREELEEILQAAPSTRRTLMFSATVSKPIAQLAQKYQANALRLNTISRREQHVDIDYAAVTVSRADVEKAVINLLLYHDAPTTLVFCARRDGVNKLAARLTNRGFSVVALSGEFSQKERSNSLLAMRDGRARVCVATDVAARGIDLPGLDLVIHADLPQNTEALLHRSGRTGRAGRKGASVLIVPDRARRRAEQLLREAGVSAAWGAAPSTGDIERVLDERILAHPALTDEMNEADAALRAQMLAQFSSEQLAAAFIRLARKGQSSPEELQAPGSDGQSRGRKERMGERRQEGGYKERGGKGAKGSGRPPSFDNGAWVSLGVGRSRNADPKWLVPMLCKAGGFERGEIGVIEVGETKTYIELTPDAADRIMDNAGEKQIIDKSLYVARADGPGADARSGEPDAMPQKPAPAEKTGGPAAKTARQPSEWVKKPKKRKGPKKPRGPNGEKKRSPAKRKKAGGGPR